MYTFFFSEEDRVRVKKASTSSSTTESNKTNMFGRGCEITESKDYLLI